MWMSGRRTKSDLEEHLPLYVRQLRFGFGMPSAPGRSSREVKMRKERLVGLLPRESRRERDFPSTDCNLSSLSSLAFSCTLRSIEKKKNAATRPVPSITMKRTRDGEDDSEGGEYASGEERLQRPNNKHKKYSWFGREPARKAESFTRKQDSSESAGTPYSVSDVTEGQPVGDEETPTTVSAHSVLETGAAQPGADEDAETTPPDVGNVPETEEGEPAGGQRASATRLLDDVLATEADLPADDNKVAGIGKEAPADSREDAESALPNVVLETDAQPTYNEEDAETAHANVDDVLETGEVVSAGVESSTPARKAKTPTPEDESVQRQWNLLKGWGRWNEFYAGIDLTDASSVDVMIRRFIGALYDLSDLLEDQPYLIPRDLTHMKVYRKIAYELGQLKRQKRFLESQNILYRRSRSSRWQDLVNRQVQFDPLNYDPSDPAKTDRTSPSVSISLSHTWGLPKAEQEAMGQAFKIHTLHGAQQGVEWLKKQIRMMLKTPLHSQPASPGRKKSQYLIDAQALLADWILRRDELQEAAAARPAAHVRRVQPDLFRILYALSTGDYRGFETTMRITDKLTGSTITTLREREQFPDIKSFPHPDLDGVVLAPADDGQPVRQRPSPTYRWETATHKYELIDDLDAEYWPAIRRKEQRRRVEQARRARERRESERRQSGNAARRQAKRDERRRAGPPAPAVQQGLGGGEGVGSVATHPSRALAPAGVVVPSAAPPSNAPRAPRAMREKAQQAAV